MSLDLYAQYVAEREGLLIISHEDGFATYQKVDDNTYYIVDIFVTKEKRRAGLAYKLADEIVDIAKKDGAKILLGSVCTTVKGVTESMAFIIGYGMKYSSTSGTMLYFAKDI